ncbi:helix-turn-helix domain-containing protein [Streptomyces filamentosus]|uniref:helix-turn-helix domain-containing protein n=1 Tax=Streptomyces filamentosus TaxID=67294 RepID=UPI00123A792B|nr:helix-turn-helix transcriptional regulator [Streptomyces filamentosus]KAA6211748.1 XRE family transcriptional regulator [Streptomyces filamentosus]KAA6220044.1 XRE family transcriptional regulator [Streptomyces filamentosus]
MNRDPHAWARLGKAIASTRKATGMRQEDLATKAGVSLGSVQNAESGAPPKARMPQSLYPIVKALGLPDTWIDDVLDGKPSGEWRDADVQGEVDKERLESDLTHALVRASDQATAAEIKAATKAALDVLRQHGLI